jgi:hypothetical protein
MQNEIRDVATGNDTPRVVHSNNDQLQLAVIVAMAGLGNNLVQIFWT